MKLSDHQYGGECAVRSYHTISTNLSQYHYGEGCVKLSLWMRVYNAELHKLHMGSLKVAFFHKI